MTYCLTTIEDERRDITPKLLWRRRIEWLKTLLGYFNTLAPTQNFWDSTKGTMIIIVMTGTICNEL